MAVSREEQRALWRKRQARRRQRLREQVEELIPTERCYRCQRFGEEMELAHIKQTPLSGTGGSRGSLERMKDVLANPEAYVRLCVPCHKGFDAGRHDLELEEAPF